MSDKYTTEQFEDTAEAMESAGEKMTARMLRQAAQDKRTLDYIVSEYERAVGCGPQGALHCSMHVFNAITNAQIDAKMREREVGGAVAEVYEYRREHNVVNSPMLTGIRFTGMPLPVGTKLYTAPRAAVPDDRLQQAISALLWVNEEVWPLVHGLTSRETLKARFRQLPDLIAYLGAPPGAPNVSPE